MSKLESLIRQAEIIKLAKRKPFTWETLDNHLSRKEEELDRELRTSKRTFNRDLTEINNFFGISIKFDFKTAIYAIKEEACSEQNMQMLEVFDMLQLFGNRGKIPAYILLEQKTARGTEHFSAIISAIEHSKRIQITYGKFWRWETENRTLKPLALKEFKQM